MSPSLRLPRFIIAMLIVAFAAIGTSGERLPVKSYTSADGLGSGFVDYLYRDSRGFMWFCTRNGLSRFDGSRFITYQIGDTSPGIESIYETREGEYWISTTNGTYRFNPDENVLTGTGSTNLNAEFVTGARGSFFEDSKGTLWLTSGTLLKLVTVDGKRQFEEVEWHVPQKPHTSFSTFRICETEDGSLWLFTSWGISRKLPDGRLITYQFEQEVYGGNGAVAMEPDRGGRIWITLLGDVFVIKPEPIVSIQDSQQSTTRPLIPTKTVDVRPGATIPMPKIGGEIYSLKIEAKETSLVRRLFQSSDGDMWITAGDHLFQISNGEFIVHTAAEGLPESMSRMEEDAAGNLWIGGNSVLARLDRHGMVTFGKQDGANSSRFSAINQGPDGSIYFANSDTYIAKLEGTKLKLAHPDVPNEIAHIWTSRFTLVDSRGDFWMLTSGALYRFSGITNFDQLDGRRPSKVYTTADGLKSNGMFQIFEDSSGDIWLSTRGVSNLGHGLARLRKGSDKFETFTEVDGLPPRKAPSAFAEDRYGNLWITFYEGGLSRFDGERFDNFEPGDNLPEGLLPDLHVDKKGRLWIASTIDGLLRIDDTTAKVPQFTNITTKDGLTSNNIRTLTEDDFGRIYLGTSSGVDCYSPDSGHIKHYSVNDGLAADFVVDSMKDGAGNVWFATSSGVSRLTPTTDDLRITPSVLIGSLRISGIEQPLSSLGSLATDRGELSHIENNVQIEFFGIDFRAGESLRYQYKLEGADADWSAPSEQRSVTYANLSPASYKFMVRAVNSEGVASEIPAVISFRILPPIWARWWFIALSVLVGAILVVAFYGYRVARLREVNSALEDARLAEERLRKSREERLAELEQVRSRIATDLHDDIGASLTQIAILSEVARAASKGNGATEPLSKITDVSNELVGTMSDIVWSINPSKDHLSDLTQRMRRFASDSFSPSGISLQFDASHAEDGIVVNSNIRRELFLIFKEAVNNIVKHSGARHARVSIGRQGSNLALRIEDDGVGFDPRSEGDGEGNGIPSIRKRAVEINAELEIGPIANGGTFVEVKLPFSTREESTGVLPK